MTPPANFPTQCYDTLRSACVIGWGHQNQTQITLGLFQACKTNCMRLKFTPYSFYSSKNHGVNNKSPEQTCKHTHTVCGTTGGRYYETPPSCRQFVSTLGTSDTTNSQLASATLPLKWLFIGLYPLLHKTINRPNKLQPTQAGLVWAETQSTEAVAGRAKDHLSGP